MLNNNKQTKNEIKTFWGDEIVNEKNNNGKKGDKNNKNINITLTIMGLEGVDQVSTPTTEFVLRQKNHQSDESGVDPLDINQYFAGIEMDNNSQIGQYCFNTEALVYVVQNSVKG